MNEFLMRAFQPKKTIKPEGDCKHLFMQLKALSTSTGADPVNRPIDGGITIDFADQDKRMRKVVRRSNYRMTGKFPSVKNGRMMQWESKLEQQVFYVLEICPFVSSYREQPARIRYVDENGVIRLHFPDILVQLRNGSEVFVEVKPASSAQDEDLNKRTNLLQKLLQSKGYYYLMVLPEQVDSGRFLDNAIHILQHSKQSLPDSICELVRRIFREHNNLKLSTLILRLEHDFARSWIYKMLISGALACDLSEPLTTESLISWAEREAA